MSCSEGRSVSESEDLTAQVETGRFVGGLWGWLQGGKVITCRQTVNNNHNLCQNIFYNYQNTILYTIELTFYSMDFSFLQIFFFVNRISNINTTESSSHALQSRPDQPSECYYNNSNIINQMLEEFTSQKKVKNYIYKISLFQNL